MNQVEFGQQVGCGWENISKIERGSTPSGPLLVAIAEKFRVDMKYLTRENPSLYNTANEPVVAEEPEDYGDKKKWRLVREIKRFAHEADAERDAKQINALLETVIAFLEVLEERKTPREEN